MVKSGIKNVFLYNDLIIGILDSGSVFVLDSTYKHVDYVERIFNAPSYRVSGALFYQNDILLLMDNNRLSIFDSSFKRKEKAENRLNSVKFQYIFYQNDSLYLQNQKNYYLVYDDYKLELSDSLTLSKKKGAFPFGPAYVDSSYTVYACGAGEFGGNVFFQHKNTGITYSFPTYFQDIVNYRGKYHLIHAYYGWSKYIKIDDPARLFEVSVIKPSSFCCNCDSDSRMYYNMNLDERKTWNDHHGLVEYFDTVDIQTVSTFIHRDKLYSFCMTDSSFLLLEHSDSIKFLQEIPRISNRNNRFYSTSVQQYNNTRIVMLDNESYSGNTDFPNAGIARKQSGFVIIKGNKIDVFEAYFEHSASLNSLREK